MPVIQRTEEFMAWFTGLRDVRAQARIETRIQRLADGNPGDVEPVGHGVSELRIDYGPGYRVYYTQRENGTIVILLCGGDKRTQNRDIKRAIGIAKDV